MGDKKILGKSSARCPACGEVGEGEIREGTNGRAYIIFDCCTSMLRTLSGRGDRGIKATLESSNNHAPKAGVGAGAEASPAAAAAAAPAQAGESKPDKKRGMFSDALDVLGGGR